MDVFLCVSLFVFIPVDDYLCLDLYLWMSICVGFLACVFPLFVINHLLTHLLFSSGSWCNRRYDLPQWPHPSHPPTPLRRTGHHPRHHLTPLAPSAHHATSTILMTIPKHYFRIIISWGNGLHTIQASHFLHGVSTLCSGFRSPKATSWPSRSSPTAIGGPEWLRMSPALLKDA